MTEFRDGLIALGASDEEIEAASQSGTLLALAAERFLLPGERRLDRADLASLLGIDLETLRKLLLALGFPEPAPSEKAFMETDVEVLRSLFEGDTTISDYSLHETRVISGAMARVAEVFIDEMWDQHFSTGRSNAEALTEIASSPYDLQRVERMLMYLLRRHLVASINRRLALQVRSESSGMTPIAVGFADVVGFTLLSQSLNASDLTRVVVRFEQTMSDLLVDTGGRIVKTIGDEVMFTFDEAGGAADFALRVTSLGDEELLPVRVGLGWGPALIRQGDCFGPTVNLTSRVVATAAGGEVVVEAAMAEQLRMHGFELDTAGERELKGFGSVALWKLVGRSSA